MSIKATMKLTLKTKGLDTLKRRVKAAGNHVAKVGYWQDMSYDGEMTLAGLAYVQEYGRLDGHIPSRPFFRKTAITAATSESRIKAELTIAMKKILAGTKTTQQALSPVGQQFADELGTTVALFDNPSNRPSTIAIKGFDDPLVHHGLLKYYIRNKVTKRGADV